ncbi:helix-turn-helix domain-containing protein [Fibrobacter succinogenes]|uniref:helix-turn-helix domain-containing protein n=1 Tax=Fibrobacter succinogenes TaxID=833 RepID=UPI001567FB06|nr:helix-turn-helix domain-containing protein [Fibrobacter succinogenes]
MYKKHTENEWTAALELYQKYYGPAQISRQTGIPKRQIERRIQQYRDTGVWLVERKPYTRSTPALKRMAVDAVLKHRLSYGETTIRYGISFSCLQSWLRKFRHGGQEELFATRPKGRPPQMGRPKKARKEPQTELEKALRELELLRAENALLKKVKALVEERIAQEQGNGR